MSTDQITPSGRSSVLQITGGKDQFTIFEVHLHLPVIRVLEEGMLRFRSVRRFAFLFTRFNKAHLLFPCDVRKAGRFLAIEVTDKFQESLFDVQEDRVVPLCNDLGQEQICSSQADDEGCSCFRCRGHTLRY